jgi:hypothetical protein
MRQMTERMVTEFLANHAAENLGKKLYTNIKKFAKKFLPLKEKPLI